MTNTGNKFYKSKYNIKKKPEEFHQTIDAEMYLKHDQKIENSFVIKIQKENLQDLMDKKKKLALNGGKNLKFSQ